MAGAFMDLIIFSEAYSEHEHNRTSTMKLFAYIVNGF